jgi:hypothetical protein
VENYQIGSSLNLVYEAAFNAFSMIQWLRSNAIAHDVEYIGNEVVGVSLDGNKVQSIPTAKR